MNRSQDALEYSLPVGSERRENCMKSILQQPGIEQDSEPTRAGLVSVVIPTWGRSQLVKMAVQSALDQTYPDIEVIVVSDGPDPDLRKVLEGLDPRLHYLELAVNSGPSAARNLGFRSSHGEWVTFLDDDDMLLPEKIERQMLLAKGQEVTKMIACRSIYRHGRHDDVWPRRPIFPDENVSDYLLLRPSLLGRPGLIQIQTLLVHRSLLNAVPFRSHSDHEDWAWLLEVWHTLGARVEYVWEPLLIYNVATDGISRSRRANWGDSLEWADSHRTWISNRAYSSFLSTKVALKAKYASDWKALKKISGLVMRSKPRALDVMFLVGIILLPSFVLQAAWKRSLGTGQYLSRSLPEVQ